MKKIYKEPNKSETETTVNVLYSEEKIKIYTNKVKLQKQLNKVLGEPSKEYKIKKSITGSEWIIELSDKIKISRMILKADIFECLDNKSKI
ncbi:MAG: hypothetical protein V8R82_06630 [Clostridia bacterium]